METWKDIKEYRSVYQVSNTGRVRSIRRFPPMLFKEHINTGGYPDVKLTVGGKENTHRIHRLVASTFIPNPENKPQVNHKNGIKTDNRVENLEWCTASENTIHSYKNGLQADRFGENAGNSTLKDDDVKTIKALLFAGSNHRMISEQFNISRPTVTAINNKRIWSHINL